MPGYLVKCYFRVCDSVSRLASVDRIKKIHPHQCRQASANPLRAGIEYEGGERVSLSVSS